MSSSAITKRRRLLQQGDRLPRRRSAVYKSKARALEELERYQDALENYQRAITYDDKDAPLWARPGGIYAKMGDMERAADAIDHSLKLDPQGRKAWVAAPR